MKNIYVVRMLSDSNVVASEYRFTSITKALAMVSVLVKSGARVDVFGMGV